MWFKGGLRIRPNGTPLMRSHAMLPTPYVTGDRVRVYFASCDENGRGRIFAAELAAEPPYEMLHIEKYPVLDIGEQDTFDCDGVNPSQIMLVGDELHLFYIGWHRRSDEVPYTLIAGHAVSRDGGLTFEKTGPLLPPTTPEPFFRTAPFVFEDQGRWRMLYIGGGQFIEGADGKRLPVYSLKGAISDDLLKWPEFSEELLTPDLSSGEIGFGRPVLWHDRSGRRLLVASKRTTDGYRLVQTPWPLEQEAIRDLDDVIPLGPERWDREMTCFAAFCQVGRHELMFYNGNKFGYDGCGVAWRRV